jgi:hypothetical protein
VKIQANQKTMVISWEEAAMAALNRTAIQWMKIRTRKVNAERYLAFKDCDYFLLYLKPHQHLLLPGLVQGTNLASLLLQ